VVVATAAAVAGGIGGGVIGARLDDGPSAARPGNSNVGQVGSSTGPTAGPGATARPEGSVASIAAKATPSVVTIRVAGADGSGTGSGWVYDDKGHIVTNNHVVASAANSGEITVILTDGSQRKATIVGRDVSYDLAVLKVDPQGLTPLPVGVSADVLVGDPVIAVGAPLGLESTVTTGDDADRSFINALQTDAAINPGNSGGPLLDMQGRVIGVNSAIARVSGDSSGSQSGSIGVGFAIPSDQVKTTADQLIATGKAVHPVIGVFLDREYTGEGVRIAADEPGRTAIVPGGPADKAGLKAGDVILTFDGRPMTSPDALVVAIRSKAVGDSVELGIERGGQKQQVTMVLKADTQ
jgi:putative serine protease PepD